MVYGYPTANVWPLDIKRFGNLQSSRTFLRHRVMEVMRESRPIVSVLYTTVEYSGRLYYCRILWGILYYSTILWETVLFYNTLGDSILLYNTLGDFRILENTDTASEH